MKRDMGARFLSVAVLSLVACNDQPSKLDGERSADPWASTRTTKDIGKAEDSGLGGLDLQGMLERVKESVDTPGPYESPKKSADFDETKPHWGVSPSGV